MPSCILYHIQSVTVAQFKQGDLHRGVLRTLLLTLFCLSNRAMCHGLIDSNFLFLTSLDVMVFHMLLSVLYGGPLEFLLVIIYCADPVSQMNTHCKKKIILLLSVLRNISELSLS